jgi:cytochrome P450
VATELTGITFFLLKTPRVYKRLCSEIRGSFSSYPDITSASAQRLPYLQAVIEEGLRIYPSGALGFPRKSPGMYIDGYWIPEGVRLALHGM